MKKIKSQPKISVALPFEVIDNWCNLHQGNAIKVKLIRDGLDTYTIYGVINSFENTWFDMKSFELDKQYYREIKINKLIDFS